MDRPELTLELSLATLASDLSWCHAARMASVNHVMRGIVDNWRRNLQALHLATVAPDAEMWLLASRCVRLRWLSLVASDGCHDTHGKDNGKFQLSGFALRAIGFGCQELESVQCTWSDQMTDRNVIALVHGLGKLRAFIMVDSFGTMGWAMHGKFLQSLAESCPLLEKLVVVPALVIENTAHFAALGAGCPRLREVHARFAQISSSMLGALASGCPNLQYLDLSHATMEDDGVIELARHCKQLEVLLLDCGSDHEVGLSDASIVPLARSCPRLRSLNLFAAAANLLEEGHALTDKSVLALGTHCKQLTKLNLGHAQRITDVAAQCLLHEFPALTHLDLWNCAGLTETYYEALDRKAGFSSFECGSRWVRYSSYADVLDKRELRHLFEP